MNSITKSPKSDDAEPDDADTVLLRRIYTNTSDANAKRENAKRLNKARVTDVLLPFPQPQKSDRLILDGLPRAFEDRPNFFKNQDQVLKEFDAATLEETIRAESRVHQHLKKEAQDYFDFNNAVNEETQGSAPDSFTPIGKGGYGTVYAVRLRGTNNEHTRYPPESRNNRHLAESEFALKLFYRPEPKDLRVDRRFHSYPSKTQRSFEEERNVLINHIWGSKESSQGQNKFSDWRLRKVREDHMIKFIASFTTPKTFGLLLSPLALCDLETLLRSCKPGTEVQVKGQTLPRTTVEEWLYEAFGCLDAALLFLKSQGVRHEEIKPTNVLLELHFESEDAEPRAKFRLCDFATAGVASSDGGDFNENVSMGQQVVDTKQYTTPQRIMKEDRSYPDDMFTLGLIYLQLMTVIHKKEVVTLENFMEEAWESDTKRQRSEDGQLNELEDNDLQEFYKVNPDYIPVLGFHCTDKKLKEWLHDLRPSELPGPSVTEGWVENLLSRRPNDRWDAETLAANIQSQKDTKFYGTCCNNLYTLAGAVEAACRSSTDEILYNGPILSYEWKPTCKEEDEHIAPSISKDSKVGERSNIGIIQTSLLERRLVLVQKWSYPQNSRHLWLSEAGTQLTYGDDSSVRLKWSDHRQLRKTTDHKNSYDYWRGLDYGNTNNELNLKFGSPTDAQEFVTNLFSMSHITNRTPELIRLMGVFKILFINRETQPHDRGHGLIGSHFMVVVRPPRSLYEATSLSGSIRLYTYDDAEQRGLNASQRGLDILLRDDSLRICGLGSIEYTASKKRLKTAPVLPNRDELPKITVQDEFLTIPHSVERPLYIFNDSRYPFSGSELPGLRELLEGLTQWKIWFFCTVPDIKRVRSVSNENLGHGLMILWKKTVVEDQRWFSIRLENNATRIQKKWRYGKVLNISAPRKKTQFYELEAESCGEKGMLDVQAFASPSRSSETFHFKLDKGPDRLKSFLIETKWDVPQASI